MLSCCCTETDTVQSLFTPSSPHQAAVKQRWSLFTPSSPHLLQEIDLSTNLISNLLGGWAGLKTLTRLDLRENMIMTGLPAGWLSATAFPALVHLDLSNNIIENTLPAGWGQALKKLQYLDLGMNVFREFRGCQLLGSDL